MSRHTWTRLSWSRLAWAALALTACAQPAATGPTPNAAGTWQGQLTPDQASERVLNVNLSLTQTPDGGLRGSLNAPFVTAGSLQVVGQARSGSLIASDDLSGEKLSLSGRFGASSYTGHFTLFGGTGITTGQVELSRK
jgi:hypothetical protein